MMNNRLIAVMTPVFFIWACDSRKTALITPPAADSVEVFTLSKEAVSKTLTLPVGLYPWERTEVYAKAEGYVRELKVDIGDRVRKNDVMVILDAPEVTANYASASAGLQAAQSRYRTSLDVYRRTRSAAKEDGAVSDSEIERVRNEMLMDSATYEAARSAANAYAQLKNYLVIRAAFDGVVTQRNVDPGTLVGKNQTPMIVLENLHKLRVRVAVPELYTSAIPESTSISFSVDAQPSKKYLATLARKSNQIDPKTRTELWEFEVANPGRELKSGMYGTASFTVKRNEAVFVAPYQSVVTTLEKRFVIRVRDGKTEWVDVRNGINTSDKMEIFGDLHEGDLLLLRPNDEIGDGQTVVVKGVE